MKIMEKSSSHETIKAVFGESNKDCYTILNCRPKREHEVIKLN